MNTVRIQDTYFNKILRFLSMLGMELLHERRECLDTLQWHGVVD